jgi:hypothetical protein
VAKITITEALAEIKTIGKRVQSKQAFVSGYVFRQDMLRDPLENQGGSKAAIQAERQSIADLESRVVRIRAAIYRANTETVVTIGNVARSIADWLVWRREVAPNAKQFVAQIRGAVNSARTQATQKGLAVRAADAAQGSPNDVVVNVDEKALADEAEALETVLGTLDGQLSLKNATTFVEV